MYFGLRLQICDVQMPDFLYLRFVSLFHRFAVLPIPIEMPVMRQKKSEEKRTDQAGKQRKPTSDQPPFVHHRCCECLEIAKIRHAQCDRTARK